MRAADALSDVHYGAWQQHERMSVIGWGLTLNAVAPQPSNESSSAQGISYEYGELKQGEVMHVWISWQTNPTTAGTRDQDVTLLDGSQPVITLQRSFTVFP